MNENEVKASLNDDVSSLDKNQKQQFTDMSDLATKGVELKKGKARKIRIEVSNKDGIVTDLVKTDTNVNKNYPKAEDKLKGIKFSDGVFYNLHNRINDGEINSTHITDLQKLTI